MATSDAEREALERLHEAINHAISVKGFTTGTDEEGRDIPMMTTDWVIIAAQRGYNAEGGAHTGVVRLEGPSDTIPWHVLLGLLEMGRIQADEHFRS